MLPYKTPHLKYLCVRSKVLTLLLSLKGISSMMHTAFDKQLPTMLLGVVWLSSFLWFENVSCHIL